MSTSLLVSIIVGVLVVGAGAYVVMNPEIVSNISGGAAEDAMMEEGEGNDNEGASVGNTFAGILALGQNVVCTFNRDDGVGNTSSGTFYMTSGGSQIRGDFTSSANGSAPMDGHIVRTGGYTYMWSDSSPQGIKTQVTNETELVADSQNTGIDDDTQYSCQAWNVDNSKFSLPSGIEFTDMSAQINSAIEASGSTDAKAQQCAACGALPAAAQAQCLAALAC